MSFSGNIKEEVSKLDCTKAEYISELSAIIRNSALYKDDSIIITIENNSVARRIYKLIKNIYDINIGITVRRRYGFSNNLIYILTVKSKIKEILKDLSLIDNNGKIINIPSKYIIDDEDTTRAYLRGVFVSSGSINDPKTSRYHLEFMVDNKEYAEFISSLLNNELLNSKVIKREKKYTIYIKEAEKISDFLRMIRSYDGVMYYEDIRIYRDHKNMTNRLNNCEQANMDKIFLTAAKQIDDINKIKEYDMLDLLDDKLKEVINYRLKYPEYSLQELADVMSSELEGNITKSGLNHRFRKIREIVLRLENKDK